MGKHVYPKAVQYFGIDRFFSCLFAFIVKYWLESWHYIDYLHENKLLFG